MNPQMEQRLRHDLPALAEAMVVAERSGRVADPETTVTYLPTSGPQPEPSWPEALPPVVIGRPSIVQRIPRGLLAVASIVAIFAIGAVLIQARTSNPQSHVTDGSPHQEPIMDDQSGPSTPTSPSAGDETPDNKVRPTTSTIESEESGERADQALPSSTADPTTSISSPIDSRSETEPNSGDTGPASTATTGPPKPEKKSSDPGLAATTSEVERSTSIPTTSTIERSTSVLTEPTVPATPTVGRPTNLTARVQGHLIKLDWDAPASSPEPSHYLVFRDGDLIGQAPSTHPTLLDETPTPDQSHSYTVYAIAEGAGDRSLGAQVAATVPSFTVTIKQIPHSEDHFMFSISSNRCVTYHRTLYSVPSEIVVSPQTQYWFDSDNPCSSFQHDWFGELAPGDYRMELTARPYGTEEPASSPPPLFFTID